MDGPPVLVASQALVRAAWFQMGAAVLQAIASGAVIWGVAHALHRTNGSPLSGNATSIPEHPQDLAHDMLDAFRQWADQATVFKQGLKEADFHAADYALTTLFGQHSILILPEAISAWAGTPEKFGKATGAVDMAIKHIARLNRDKIKYRYELDTLGDAAKAKLARVVCLQCRVCADAIVMARQAAVSAMSQDATPTVRHSA